LVVAIERVDPDAGAARSFRVEAEISEGQMRGWSFAENGDKPEQANSIRAGLESIFECQIPLQLLQAAQGALLRVRFSLWRDGLPLDALPQEGAMEIRVAPEAELSALPYAKP
jgi:hypothetical protein